VSALRPILSGLSGPVGGHWLESRKALLFADRVGRINTLNPENGAVATIGDGFFDPTHVIATADETRLYISERSGSIVEVPLDAADRASGRVVTSNLTAPHQLVLSPDQTSLLVIEGGTAGRLVRVLLTSGEVTSIAGSFDQAAGLALLQSGEKAYVAEQSSGNLIVVDIISGEQAVVASGLQSPLSLSWTDGVLLIPESQPTNRLSLVTVEGGGASVTHLIDTPSGPSSAVRIGTEILIICEAEIVGLNPRKLRHDVRFRLPEAPLFVGQYVRVPVEIGAALSLEKIQFDIPDGRHAGMISLSRDATFDPTNPEIMLIAGTRPGTWRIVARLKSNGEELASDNFTVSTDWEDIANGPGIATVGSTMEMKTLGGSWGGGLAGPQYDKYPIINTPREIIAVLLDTASQRWTTAEAASAQTFWQNAFAGLVNDYCRETSGGMFSFQLFGNVIHGPFSVPETWDMLFADEGVAFQKITNAIMGSVDLHPARAVVFFVRSVDAVPAAYHPNLRTPFVNYENAAGDEESDSLTYVGMPSDLTPGRVNTLLHELMHTLGLPDYYLQAHEGNDPTIMARDLSTWDIMSRESALSQLCLYNKLRLGWVPRNETAIRCFDFSRSGLADEMVTIQATSALGSSGAPPQGRYAGIEIRRAGGENTYFEYRAAQVGMVTDQALPTNQAILGTDTLDTSSLVRRHAVLLNLDVDGDGPVLAVPGADYHEQDQGAGFDFRITLVSQQNDHAVVRVTYGTGDSPDPAIRDWPGGTNWQSPDIEIRNDLNNGRPGLRNVPHAGHENRIVATIHNYGPMAVINLPVFFFVRNFNASPRDDFGEMLGGGPQIIPSIPPFGSAQAEVIWNIPANVRILGEHYCVAVRIAHYQDPINPRFMEHTELNNIGRSNYTLFVSKVASPATRGMTRIAVTNTTSKRTRAWIRPKQTLNGYRIYAANRWLWLDPDETRDVEVMYESLYGDPAYERDISEFRDFFWQQNEVSISAHLELHDQRCRGEISGGVNIALRTAYETRFEVFQADRFSVSGRVVVVEDGRGVNGGTVVVSIRRWFGQRGISVPIEVDEEGWFASRIDLSRGSGWIREHANGWSKIPLPLRIQVQGHYVLHDRNASCESKRVSVSGD
jgi:hypothetical protein